MLRAIGRHLKRTYFRLLRLVFYSVDSHHKIAMGAAWGMFWGLTPTVGIQITTLTIQYGLFFFLNRLFKGKLSWLQFNLPISIGFTWLSNPANIIPLYFAFYFVGALLLPGWEALGWGEFSELLQPLLNVQGMESLRDALVSLGSKVVYPMVMGSLFIAIPSSVGIYFFVRMILRRATSRRQSRDKSRLA